MCSGRLLFLVSVFLAAFPSADCLSLPQAHHGAYEEEEDSRPDYTGHHLAAVMKPVAVTMACAVLVVLHIRQPGQDSELSSGLRWVFEPCGVVCSRGSDACLEGIRRRGYELWRGGASTYRGTRVTCWRLTRGADWPCRCSVYLVSNENAPDNTSAQKFSSSLLNSLVIIGVITVATFVLVLCYKYRCMKVRGCIH